MEDTTNPVEPEVEDAPVEDAEIEDSELDEYGNPVEKEDGAEDDEDEDLDEIEINGKVYRVPREAALRQADYTRKTQEIADQRRNLESLTARAEELSDSEVEAQRRLIQLDASLAQFNGINWDQARKVNPMAAMQAQLNHQRLQQEMRDAQNELYRVQMDRQSFAQEQHETRLREGMEILAKKIDGWGDEKIAALSKAASEIYGFSPDEFVDPRMVVMLNDAVQFANANSKQRARKQAEEIQAVRPASKVKGAASSPRRALDDRSDIKSWMAARNKAAGR